MSTLEEIRNEIKKKQEMRALMRINELTGKKPSKSIQEVKYEDDDASDPRMDPTKDPYEGQPPPFRSSTRKSRVIHNQSPIKLMEQKEKIPNIEEASKKPSQPLSAVKKTVSQIMERKAKENENVINLVQNSISVKKEKVQEMKESPMKRVSPIKEKSTQLIEIRKIETKEKKRKEIVIDEKEDHEPDVIHVESIRSTNNQQKEEATAASLPLPSLSIVNDEVETKKFDKMRLFMRLTMSLLHAILFAGVVFCAIVIIDMNKYKSGYEDEYIIDAPPQQHLLESLSSKFSLVISHVRTSNELVLANADISLHNEEKSNEVKTILIGMMSGAIVGFVIGARA